ncbi:proton-coupled zinc antiporter SLC30A9, mitochondrial-like isoform X2 [Branchiostoma lanceolatum]|uniref:proton-coupled zinc antiporter SLC30A9, mitochondrial-like isoform X2 n=1 Tax=Branchiostoma lanceolatum TaxID=7740 RepID=UPI003456A242
MRILRLFRGVAFLRQELMSRATSCAHRQCHTGVCRSYCFCQPVLVSGLSCFTNTKALQTPGLGPPQYYTVRHLCSSGSGKTEPPKETGKTAATEGDSKKASSKDKLVKTIFRVKPKPRKRIDYSKAYTDNNTITAVRAMSEFLLKPSDLEGLRKTARRSPYSDPNSPPLMVYLRADVEQKAIEVWESMAALEREMQKREKNTDAQKQYTFRYKKALKEYRKFFGEGGVEPPFIFGSGKPQDRSYLEEPIHSLFSGSGRVVMMAIGINSLNFAFKLVAWVFTGSASMFSEAIHSLADTINQSILAFGIHQSIRKPNPDHPYGFSNMRYVSSLVSGVGIFCVGSGLSIYHGVLGLIDPQPMESFFWAYCILAGSLVSEGATLLVATAQIRKSAKAQGMQFMEYVWRSRDPSVNVVLLEDAAAVLGVAIAATCMGLTSLTGNPIYDAMGSITIGGLLAMVSAFLIYTNAEALIGRSIPPDQLDRIMHSLEDDVMVRAIHDIKATEMGLNIVRFKAEVDFDGREVTRSYLDKVDLEALLQEVQQYQTLEDMEGFMLRHGENIIDILGAEVDRLETQLKKKNPEVKHVDLEIL